MSNSNGIRCRRRHIYSSAKSRTDGDRTRDRGVERKLSSSDFGRFAQIVSTLADSRHSDARAEQEKLRGARHLPEGAGCRYAIQRKRGRGKEGEKEVVAPGKSRESQILPCGREATSGRRETSLITTGIRYRVSSPAGPGGGGSFLSLACAVRRRVYTPRV